MRAWMHRKINDRLVVLENKNVHQLIEESYQKMQEVKGSFTQFNFLHGSPEQVIEHCADVAATMVAIAEDLDNRINKK